MGQHSLLVYWVHIEFVYGRLHILPRKAESILGATAGLLIITLSMLLLAYLQGKWDTRKKQQLRAQAVPAKGRPNTRLIPAVSSCPTTYPGKIASKRFGAKRQRFNR